jgi:aerobic-type carbon monoxide dehydrogenase small subunit (CoxS/CutS family)
MIRIMVNGEAYELEDDKSSTPLLWILRDQLGLVGTKFGCGGGYCGACTVHLNDRPVRSCSTLTSAADGAEIRTIEGLANSDGELHPLQEAWIAHDVPQCGYCQAGQLMSAAALLASNPSPSDKEIDSAMAGNLCRCGTYLRIRKAIHSAAESAEKTGGAA